jgi:hypothetical protein
MAAGELTREMADRLKAWLDGPGGSGPLVEWLQGYDLPPVGYADEPYLWLLRGIRAIGPELSSKQDGQTYDHLFCKQVAGLLDDRPDRDRPGDNPERVLYNLFRLCAGLRCPACLAEGLRAILEAKQLSGSWFGVDLRSTLRSALVENQRLQWLRTTWLAMIRGESGFLPGDEFTGMAGLLKMPESEAARGQPAVEAICAGLSALVQRLEKEDDENPRARLVEMIEEVRRAFPDYDRWDRDFMIEGADKSQWPKWAFTTLATLIPAGDQDGDVYTWKIIADCVRHTDGIRPSGHQVYCGGYFERLRVTDTTAMERLGRIAGSIDAVLSKRKDLGFKSILCYINETMMDLEEEEEEDEDKDKTIDVVTARRGLLERSGVLSGMSC